MIESILPPLAAAGAITATYFFCIRPMRRGRGCHMSGQQSSCATSDTQDSTDAEIERLREEVQLLHHELELRSQGAVQLRKDETR